MNRRSCERILLCVDGWGHPVFNAHSSRFLGSRILHGLMHSMEMAPEVLRYGCEGRGHCLAKDTGSFPGTAIAVKSPD